MPRRIESERVDAVWNRSNLEGNRLEHVIVMRLVVNLCHLEAAVPDPQRYGHQVVVNEASKCSEKAHKNKNIAHAEDCFHAWSFRSNEVAKKAQNRASKEKDEAVADISEHYTKEVWESNNGEHTWVDLLVGGNAISVYDLLEDPGDFVEAEERRRPNCVVMNWLQGRNLNVAVVLLERLDLVKHRAVVSLGNPAEAKVKLLFFLELVEGRIETLFLLEENAVNLKQRYGLFGFFTTKPWLLRDALHFS